MRAGAKVNVVALFKERKLLVLGQIVDKLNLVRLAGLLHKLYSLVARKGKALQLKVFLNDFFHLDLKRL